MTTIQTQNFGVEIELTSITRRSAANVIANYYGTSRPSSAPTIRPTAQRTARAEHGRP